MLVDRPPRSVCLVRLSALGDTCHTVAVLRALQAAWPETAFTWVIGAAEHRLIRLVDGVRFVTFDKRRMLAELVRIRAELRGQSFDLLLHMQLSFRASLVAALVRSPLRVGFDRARARELQWLFTNREIAPRRREHVLDGLMGFAHACGVVPGPPRWHVPLPEAARAYAERIATGAARLLLVSPCSSHPQRNWHAHGYAAAIDHAVRVHGMQAVLVGGRSVLEAQAGAEIEALATTGPLNQIGKDTLPELLALMARADGLITPDSGPAHMATMVGLPVIGLYAATNPARSGPYLSRALCVDRYAEAALIQFGRTPDELDWMTKIERPGVMDLVTVPDVLARIDALPCNGPRRAAASGGDATRAQDVVRRDRG